MRKLLLVIWLAMIGADRIDFLAGKGDFGLTPYLVLTMLIAVLFLPRLLCTWPSLSLPLPRNMPAYVWLATLLVVLILISALFGLDVELGLKRFVLLAAEVYGTILIAAIMYNTRGLERILLHGAYAGILLSALFDATQLLAWLPTRFSETLRASAVLNFIPPSFGVLAPRPAGVSVDANRGGMLIVFYAFLVLRSNERSRWRTAFVILAVLLLMLTLSRSAFTALVLLGGAMFIQGRKPETRLLTKVMAIVCIALIASVCLIGISRIEAYNNLAELLSERTSLADQTSGGYHLALFDTGATIADAGARNLLIGIGFGSSYRVLDRFFAGNLYANFHSIYVSLLVENGIPALFVFLLICLLPFLRTKNYFPLLLGLMAFNVFYQLILEPMLWFCLVMVWTDLSLMKKTTL